MKLSFVFVCMSMAVTVSCCSELDEKALSQKTLESNTILETSIDVSLSNDDVIVSNNDVSQSKNGSEKVQTEDNNDKVLAAAWNQAVEERIAAEKYRKSRESTSKPTPNTTKKSDEELEEEKLAKEAAAKKKAEEERLAREAAAKKKAEEERLAKEAAAKKKAEEERLAKEAEAKKKAEEERLAKEAEAKKKAEEERLAKEAEAKKKAEEERLAKEAAAKKKAEEERLAKEAEAKRKAEEEAARKIVTEVQVSDGSVKVMANNGIAESDKIAVANAMDEITKIIRRKDYNGWLKYLSEESISYWSAKENLDRVSEKLPIKGIKLKTLKDYFNYVFIPSRTNKKIDEMWYLTPELVKAVQIKDDKQAVIVYYFEKINGKWLVKLDEV